MGTLGWKATKLTLLRPARMALSRRSKRKQRHKNSPAVGQSPLLSLPGEIRNRIYRYALINDDDAVAVTSSGIPEEGLLLASTQIRQECVEIFYYENNFYVPIPYYDSSVLVKWCAKLRLMHKRHQKAIDYNLKFGIGMAVPHWENLILWLKGYHDKDLDRGQHVYLPSEAPEDFTVDQMIVGGMFNIVLGMMFRPWVEVLKVLEEQHCILSRIDRRWE